MKMLVVFEKSLRLRHIGHLDLMRAMQRALRRSGLPVCYSQGFNPHLLVTFAAPLSVGMYGLREVMEAPLAQGMDESEFLERLRAALPPDLPALEAYAVPDTHAKPMALLRAAAYRAALPDAALLSALPDFLKQRQIPAIRKTKTGDKPCDIRPMIHALAGEADERGAALSMTLSLCEAETCKPALLLESLSAFAGVQPPRALIGRTQLFGRDDRGALAPLELL